MDSGSALFNSKSWYNFVSEHAVKDAKLQACLKDYARALSDLTNRVAELAAQHPEVNVKIARVADGSMSGGMLKQIQDYAAAHGKTVSIDDLRNEAQNSGLNIAHVA